MQKRGQLTIFIIIGILILGIILFLFVLSEKKIPEKEKDIGNERNEYVQYVESCLVEPVQNAAIVIGLQGGILNPTESFPLSIPGERTLNIPLYSTIDSFQKKEEVERSLSSAVRKIAYGCFTYPKYNITQEERWDIDLKLQPKEIVGHIKHPVEINIDQKTAYVDIFKVKASSFLGEAHEAAGKILKQSWCIDCLAETLPPSFYVDETIINEEEGVIIIRSLKKDTLVYNFAEKVPFMEETNIFSLPKSLEVKVGEDFSFSVEPANFEFSDNSDLFNITKDGKIDFTAQEEDIGEHSFLLIAKNKKVIYIQEGVIIIR